MTSRREFVATSAASAASGLSGRGQPRSSPVRTILFQGDSITDCGRDRHVLEPNRAAALATGYPLMAASTLLREHPDMGLQCFNRGVSGNKVPDLQARWQDEAIALRPDILSILIGVNDLWHKLRNNYSGTVADYESQYTALLEQTKSALPGVRLVVLEPFVLHTGQVTDEWFPEFDERRAVAQRVARAAGAQFIALHENFQHLTRRAPAEYWAADGVHPTPAGHAVIAQAWLQAVHV
jgi:lysophospholipase L1-like esterase